MSLPREFSIFLVCAWICHMQKGCLSFIYLFINLFIIIIIFLFIHFIFSIDVIWSLKRQERNESKLLFSAPDYYFRSPKSKFVI